MESTQSSAVMEVSWEEAIAFQLAYPTATAQELLESLADRRAEEAACTIGRSFSPKICRSVVREIEHARRVHFYKVLRGKKIDRGSAAHALRQSIAKEDIETIVWAIERDAEAFCRILLGSAWKNTPDHEAFSRAMLCEEAAA